MRLLVISHPPLDPGFGASQIALNLGEALRGRGHDAVVWSPEPLREAHRWDRWRAQRRAIERFAAEAGPWDAIDVPAVSASPRLARMAPLIARSVQPELLYLAAELRAQLRRPATEAARALAHLPYTGSFALALRRGWERARLIVCLGAQEHATMLRRFPRWAGKLRRYVTAPAPAERAGFSRVREARARHTLHGGREPTGTGLARVPQEPARRAPAGGFEPAGAGFAPVHEERAPQPAGARARFLWIGRWAAHKGTDRLVAWMRERAAAFPGDSFTVAGCGPAAARDCPPDLVASGRLRLVPTFRREELPALLAAHDAGLFTSTAEGWGLCLNEMLEAGLPVAATPAGGVADLRPFWGRQLLPFPPPAELPAHGPDPEALARYLHHFSWEEIARRYEQEVLLPAADREA